MDWLESILYGFVSGLTEFIPVSAQAHQALMGNLFGGRDLQLMKLVIHVAVAVALYGSSARQINRLLLEQKLGRIAKRRRKRRPDHRSLMDIRFVRLAVVPMLVCLGAYPFLAGWRTNMFLVSVLLAINGIALYIPMHMPLGNKDSRSMTVPDGILCGFAAGAGVLPGISRVGACTSAAVSRGANPEEALSWSLLLSLPALIVLSVLDGFSLITQGLGDTSAMGFVCVALAAVASYFGALAGIRLMRFLSIKTGFSGFAYYCWGAALFSFIIYLTI